MHSEDEVRSVGRVDSTNRSSPGVVVAEADQDSVLRLVLYFDIFRHPLTMGELEKMLAPGEPGRVETACCALEARGIVEIQGRYVFQVGMSHFVVSREERAGWAERSWPAATRAARILSHLPFVEGVMVTGGMSKNSTDSDGDVDFLLLVSPGRVWILKTGLQVARRCMPLGGHEYFCTNYLLSVDELVLYDRNLFIAVELATAVPMIGSEACTAFLRANEWARGYIPGLDWSIERARHAPPTRKSWIARTIEATSRHLGAERLDGHAMAGWNRYWNHKYGWLEDQVREQRFKRRAEVSTNHLHDFQAYVLRELRRRCEQVGRPDLVGDPLPGSSIPA
jgi:hypothetical protein